MRQWLIGYKIAILPGVIFFTLGWTTALSETPKRNSFDNKGPVFRKLSHLAIPFVANRGQVNEEVSFYIRTLGGTLFVTKKGEMVYAFSGAEKKRRKSQPANIRRWVLKENLLNTKELRPEGRERAKTRVNYFIGDKSKWRTGISTYNRIAMDGIYEGIDLSLKAHGHRIEKIFEVKPGGKVNDIKIHVEGAERLTVNRRGQLELKSSSGGLIFSAPSAFQVISGRKENVKVSYDIQGRTYGFRVGDYDPRAPLVIDPVLIYSTYLGGSGDDRGQGIAVDAAGNAYITGYTQSDNFPTLNQYQTDQGGDDAFVTKLDATGSFLVYSTYLGGGDNDRGQGIAVDAAGNAYITGYTDSDLPSPFPTQNAYQGFRAGGDDAFVTKLDATGSSLVYSTYLGGNSNDDYGQGIAVDAAGNAYITGYTQSDNFPTLNQYQTDQGGDDAFVTKLDATGSSLVYSTYLGGNSNDDYGQGIAVDAAGNAYVTGYTQSNDFPIQNQYQMNQFGDDAFVTKLDATGSSLVYSTYLGGGGFPNDDYGQGIAVDAAGNAYVTGYTNSNFFPTQNAYQGIRAGGDDAFVTKIDTNQIGLASLVYSTYLGGSGDERGQGIALYDSRTIYITGRTDSNDFPLTPNAYQGSRAGQDDAFITILNTPGQELIYSTYLGGADNDDRGQSIAVDGSGNFYITGYTRSDDFPTVDAYQGIRGGSWDAFAAKFTWPNKTGRFYFGQAHNLDE
ncbi:SBBP repeat-containing protein [Thermodesulfobacteriota bacterium]